jgi:hypothetical protein
MRNWSRKRDIIGFDRLFYFNRGCNGKQVGPREQESKHNYFGS